MLSCSDLEVAFGRVEVLRGLSFEVGAREIVVLLGPNGSGKSTSLKTISGVVRSRAGEIEFAGGDMTGASVGDRVKAGITLVPQGRRLFGGMTVEENLRLGAFLNRDRPEAVAAAMERCHDLFPITSTKRGVRAGQLSGGEQQMVAVARGLMAEPRMLLLDEPSLGISPLMSSALMEKIAALRDQLGLTILLVEQNAPLALSIADRAIVIKRGVVAAEGPPNEFEDRMRLADLFLS